MPDIIVLQSLSKRYRGADGPAIREIDLTIHEGEIFGLLGPNGAGKSTLIAILCGLFPPTSGDAVIAGQSVRRAPLAVKQLVGVVPEEIALYPQLSARKNLRYFGRLYGLVGQELAGAVDATLARVGLADRGDERVGRYSNGMKRRLNIGVGLLHRPRVLLMDEPTVGLDPESRRRILDLVLQLKEESHTTIVYATHRMEEAEEISDRVGVMHRGRIIAVGAPDDLIRTLPVGESLRLELGASGVPAGAADALRLAPGVNRVTMTEGALNLIVSGAMTALPGVLRIIDEHGLDVRCLTVSKPKLETLFLRLTGEEYTELP